MHQRFGHLRASRAVVRLGSVASCRHTVRALEGDASRIFSL